MADDWFENIYQVGTTASRRHIARVTMSHGIRGVTFIAGLSDGGLKPLEQVAKAGSYRLVVAALNPTHREIDFVGEGECRDGSVEFIGRPSCVVPVVPGPLAQRNSFLFRVSTEPEFIEANIITVVNLNYPLQGKTRVTSRRVQNVASIAVGDGETRDLSDVAGTIDVAIVTIKEAEYSELLKHFPVTNFVKGKNGLYALSEVPTNAGGNVRLALARSIEQGPVSASGLARDMLEDLKPSVMMLVGIAGTIPDDDVTLGDVVVATRLHDFTVSAAQPDGQREHQNQGGPMHGTIQDLLSHLPALEPSLAGWQTAPILQLPKPTLRIDDAELYGPDEWRVKVRKSLEYHFPPGKEPGPPKVVARPIASSGSLVKDPQLATAWLNSARDLNAIEMELSGVYNACNSVPEPVPLICIRGISDVVGLRRHRDWTQFACASASAFAKQLLVKCWSLLKPK